MKRNHILIAILALAVSAASAFTATDSDDDLVLAKVNGEAITLQYLRDSFSGSHAGHTNLLIGEEIIRNVVDNAVEDRLLIQEGLLQGVHEEPGFERALEAYKDALLLDVLKERHLRKASEASDEEIQHAYSLLRRQVHVGLIETRDASNIRSARMRVIGGEAFDVVARQVSTHLSRGQGGDLGWVTWGILDPATEKMVLETAVGSVSEPFEAGDGSYRIVRVSDERAGDPQAMEKIIDRIRGVIASRKQYAQKKTLLDEIMKAHPPSMDEVALRKLVSSPDPGPGETPDHTDPEDETILMTTATGIPVSAGYIRERARKSGLSLEAAWAATRDEVLLYDEARRRIEVDVTIRKKLDIFTDQRVRAEVERVMLSGLDITEAAARAVYDNDPNAFAGPPSYHIRHIVLSTHEDALEVHRLLEEGGDFGELVGKRSVDLKTKDRGGDLGWLDATPDPGDSLAEIRRAIFVLGPGQHTGVMKIKLGYAIVQVLSVRPPLVPPYEQVRDAAARVLFSRHRDALVTKLRNAAEIETMEKNIAMAVAIQERLVTNRADIDSPQAP